MVRTEPERRNSLIDHLLARGVSAGVHYKPLTHYPPYAGQHTPPVTEREWRRMVTLPMFAGMSEAEQGLVIDAVKDWCKQ